MKKPEPKKTTKHLNHTFTEKTAYLMYHAMRKRLGKYAQGHLNWACDNEQIIKAFFDFADEQRMMRVKVSHRFAVEFLRWKTERRELFCEFKINNNNITMLGHAYNDCGGSRAGYFTLKEVDVVPVPKGY
jgi:DNA modification methylase